MFIVRFFVKERSLFGKEKIYIFIFFALQKLSFDCWDIQNTTEMFWFCVVLNYCDFFLLTSVQCFLLSLLYASSYIFSRSVCSCMRTCPRCSAHFFTDNCYWQFVWYVRCNTIVNELEYFYFLKFNKSLKINKFDFLLKL